MKRFHFRLDRVLDARRLREDIRKKELGQAKQELNEGEHRLTAFEENHRLYQNKLRETQSLPVLKVRELATHHRYVDLARLAITAQRSRVKTLTERVEERREALVDASRDKKVLENLREKRIEAHGKALGRSAQLFLDEIAHRHFSGGPTCPDRMPAGDGTDLIPI